MTSPFAAVIPLLSVMLFAVLGSTMPAPVPVVLASNKGVAIEPVGDSVIGPVAVRLTRLRYTPAAVMAAEMVIAPPLFADTKLAETSAFTLMPPDPAFNWIPPLLVLTGAFRVKAPAVLKPPGYVSGGGVGGAAAEAVSMMLPAVLIALLTTRFRPASRVRLCPSPVPGAVSVIGALTNRSCDAWRSIFPIKLLTAVFEINASCADGVTGAVLNAI